MPGEPENPTRTSEAFAEEEEEQRFGQSPKGCKVEFSTTNDGRSVDGMRPRKYKTPAALSRACEAYFLSITREVKLTEWVDTGERTARGKAVCRERDVLGADGQPVYKTVYTSPPTVTGLCLALGISRDTWENYFDEDVYPGYADIVRRAKLRMEAYLEEALLSREKSVQGIIFNLQNNYGWREKREVELGEATRRAVRTEAMTMEEKLALIREAAADAGGIEGAGEGDEEPPGS